MWVCSNCKSNDVHQKAWVELNPTGTPEIDYINDQSGDDFICLGCGGNHKVEEWLNPKPFIGYQVVRRLPFGGGLDIHPEMEASFCVTTSLEVAEEIAVNDPNDKDYFILHIYKGDIEEPTFI